MIFLSLVMLLSSCAQVPIKKITASGKAEAEYNKSLADVKSAIVVFCNNSNVIVEQETDRLVVCSKEAKGGGAVFTQLMLGNAYSTTPKNKIRFSMYEKDGKTKVWVDQSVETQMVGGQVNSMAQDNNAAINRNQEILDIEIPKYF